MDSTTSEFSFYTDGRRRVVGFYKGWAYWSGFHGMYTHRCYSQGGIGAGTVDLSTGRCNKCKEPLTPEIKNIIDGLHLLLGYYE